MKHIDGVERDIPGIPWGRTSVLMVILLSLAVAGWELNWRSHGYVPLPKDTNAFWSIQRRAASRADHPTVLVGSSRVLFDINLDVWEETVGERPIQLALEGTSGAVGLAHLANDSTFSGTVLVGVTPSLFFSGIAMRRSALDHYDSESPTEWMSEQIALRIEPYFAFLENENLPLFELLQDIPMKSREGVGEPHMGVMKLSVSEWDRNTYMWSRVETDSVYRNLAREIWVEVIGRLTAGSSENGPPDPQPVFDEVKGYVEAIRARGGDVVFVRCPSTNVWRESEGAGFPKEKFWDRLLVEVNAGGVHFEDNPALQGLDLPEWSHLSAASARQFTAALAPLVKQALETRAAVITTETTE